MVRLRDSKWTHKGSWITPREENSNHDPDSKLLWYADDCKLHSDRDPVIPDVFMFGGVIMTHRTERILQERIESIKGRYVPRRAPLKWNVKGTRKAYKNLTPRPEYPRPMEVYDRLLLNADQIRREIFEELAMHDVKLVVSCIRASRPDRESIIQVEKDLQRFAFINALMRFGLQVRGSEAASAAVCMDWPSGENSKVYDEEYAHAYNFGTSCHGVDYLCGPLNLLGFDDSPHFKRHNHTTLIQLADLVMGATKEFIECALGKRNNALGVEVLRNVASKFRGFPDGVVGWGISVNTDDMVLLDKLTRG